MKIQESVKEVFGNMNSKIRAIIVISIILLLFITIMMIIMSSVSGTTETTIVFDTVDGAEIEPTLINNEYELPTPTR